MIHSHPEPTNTSLIRNKSFSQAKMDGLLSCYGTRGLQLSLLCLAVLSVIFQETLKLFYFSCSALLLLSNDLNCLMNHMAERTLPQWCRHNQTKSNTLIQVIRLLIWVITLLKWCRYTLSDSSSNLIMSSQKKTAGFLSDKKTRLDGLKITGSYQTFMFMLMSEMLPKTRWNALILVWHPFFGS